MHTISAAWAFGVSRDKKTPHDVRRRKGDGRGSGLPDAPRRQHRPGCPGDGRSRANGTDYQIFTSLSHVCIILSPALHWKACANCGMLAADANARTLAGACGSTFNSSSAVFSRAVPSQTRAELRKNLWSWVMPSIFWSASLGSALSAVCNAV